MHHPTNTWGRKHARNQEKKFENSVKARRKDLVSDTKDGNIPVETRENRLEGQIMLDPSGRVIMPSERMRPGRKERR